MLFNSENFDDSTTDNSIFGKQWILWVLLLCAGIAFLSTRFFKKPTQHLEITHSISQPETKITEDLGKKTIPTSTKQKTSSKSSDKKYKHLKTIPFGRFTSTFNDKNDKHLEAAQNLGIEPVSSREEAMKDRWSLQEIVSCDDYTIDKLTHSIPYLVPEAKDLLETIGERFLEIQKERGGGEGYRLIVTSVLRVDEDIKKLQRRNTNASNNSAHRYGTTFDIAYNRFDGSDAEYKIYDGELKHLLGEVLLELKKAERCYVKYEVKQGCFHVTAR